MKNKNKLNVLFISSILFGNVFLGKIFASLNFFNFIYINEIILGLIILLNVKQLKQLTLVIPILLITPIYSIVINNYPLIEVLRDFALIYYPVIIFFILKNSNSLVIDTEIVLSIFKKIYIYIPLIYFFLFPIFNNKFNFLFIRPTEIINFSLLFFALMFNNKKQILNLFLFFTPLLFFVLMHRSSIIVFTISLILFMFTFRFDIKQILIILISLLTIFVLYNSLINFYTNLDFHQNMNFLSVRKDRHQIFERSLEIKDIEYCEQYYYNNPNSGLERCVWSNIEFRTVLWKAVLKDPEIKKNFLIRNYFGVNFVNESIKNKIVPFQMYDSALKGGLRNPHNSILNLIYRTGLIPFFLLMFLYLSKLKIIVYNNLSNLIFLILVIQTTLDPLFEGPIFSVTYFWLFWYTFNKQSN